MMTIIYDMFGRKSTGKHLWISDAIKHNIPVPFLEPLSDNMVVVAQIQNGRLQMHTTWRFLTALPRIYHQRVLSQHHKWTSSESNNFCAEATHCSDLITFPTLVSDSFPLHLRPNMISQQIAHSKGIEIAGIFSQAGLVAIESENSPAGAVEHN